MQDVAGAVAAELESHSAERRKALQEVAERLQAARARAPGADRPRARPRRASAWRGSSPRSSAARSSRCAARSPARPQHATEAAGTHFDGTIRAAREDAARRLARELELSVERFAREAETVLAERVDSELRSAEARLNELARRLDSLSTRT